MNTHRGQRRLLALAIGALAVFAPSPARGATTTVIERGADFVPAQVEIAVGDTVVWRFESAPPNSPNHTVTFDDGTDLNRNCPGTLFLDDCQSRPGQTVQRTFTAAGTFPYYCKIHGGPGGQGMAGVVLVAAAAASPTTIATSSTTTTTTTTTTIRQTTTTVRVTSSTTSTTRELVTSSTSTTTTPDPSTVLLPGDPPPFSDGDGASAPGASGGGGSDAATVAVIVALLAAVSAGGGYLLWRIRPSRA